MDMCAGCYLHACSGQQGHIVLHGERAALGANSHVGAHRQDIVRGGHRKVETAHTHDQTQFAKRSLTSCRPGDAVGKRVIDLAHGGFGIVCRHDEERILIRQEPYIIARDTADRDGDIGGAKSFGTGLIGDGRFDILVEEMREGEDAFGVVDEVIRDCSAFPFADLQLFVYCRSSLRRDGALAGDVPPCAQLGVLAEGDRGSGFHVDTSVAVVAGYAAFDVIRAFLHGTHFDDAIDYHSRAALHRQPNVFERFGVRAILTQGFGSHRRFLTLLISDDQRHVRRNIIVRLVQTAVGGHHDGVVLGVVIDGVQECGG